MPKNSEKLPTFPKALKLAGLKNHPGSQLKPALRSAGSEDLAIEWIKPGELKPDPKNPRVQPRTILAVISAPLSERTFSGTPLDNWNVGDSSMSKKPAIGGPFLRIKRKFKITHWLAGETVLIAPVSG